MDTTTPHADCKHAAPGHHVFPTGELRPKDVAIGVPLYQSHPDTLGLPYWGDIEDIPKPKLGSYRSLARLETFDRRIKTINLGQKPHGPTRARGESKNVRLHHRRSEGYYRGVAPCVTPCVSAVGFGPDQLTKSIRDRDQNGKRQERVNGNREQADRPIDIQITIDEETESNGRWIWRFLDSFASVAVLVVCGQEKQWVFVEKRCCETHRDEIDEQEVNIRGGGRERDSTRSPAL
ncbi:hypothetical protein BJV74DRAFT_796753 [Russula compacta]|nr:hypothetical protein BJV74DRAFT_796753 [Russula compacta]